MDVDNLTCKVCGTKYNVEHAERLDWQNGLTPKHCLQTIALVVIMCVSLAGVWILIQFVDSPAIRMLAAGTELLVVYVCVK